MGNTVIHQLMIHHHPMIHFCNVNNFLKNAYFVKKQFFLNICIYSPSTVKIWQGLNKFQVQCGSFKTGCFPDLAEKVSHHPMIHLCFGNFSTGTYSNLLKFGRCKLGVLQRFNMQFLWQKKVILNLKWIFNVSVYH